MDENTTIEITPEEREKIIANIKRYIGNHEIFFGNRIARVIQSDYQNDNECWAKLLALIEYAPENGMQWPLDKDGVEIKPGDTVYIGEDEYAVAYIEYGTKGVMVRVLDSSILLLRNPRDLTHNKPRTLDDIKDNIYDLTFECDKERVSKLIDEIYEIGKAAKDE